MKMRVGLLSALIGLLAVAGCGGGNDTEVAPPGDPLDRPDATFGQIGGDFLRMIAIYDDPFPTTGLAEMPRVGSATYVGSAVYSDRTSDPAMIRTNPTSASRVQVTANFTAADVNGRLYNFQAANPAEVISGELALTGIIEGNTFRGGVFGAPGGVEGTLSINGVAADHTGVFLGNFMGSAHEAVTGLVVHQTPQTQTSGVFVGER